MNIGLWAGFGRGPEGNVCRRAGWSEYTIVHDGKYPSSVVTDHPDPLSYRILQEFRIDQGVGGSQSGLGLGSVPEKSYNGALNGAGLGIVWIAKTGGFLRGIVSDGILPVFLSPVPEKFP